MLHREDVLFGKFKGPGRGEYCVAKSRQGWENIEDVNAFESSKTRSLILFYKHNINKCTHMYINGFITIYLKYILLCWILLEPCIVSAQIGQISFTIINLIFINVTMFIMLYYYDLVNLLIVYGVICWNFDFLKKNQKPLNITSFTL